MGWVKRKARPAREKPVELLNSESETVGDLRRRLETVTPGLS